MTKIEWCDETLNPITGCTPISAGCEHCYAARMAKRLAGRCGYPETDPFRPGVWHENQFQKISKIPGKGKRIFIGSMGDIFHPKNNLQDVVKVFTACSRNTDHDFLFLTKRPEARRIFMGYDYANIWFGVTAENQETLDARLPDLRQIPAQIRFLSVEPMLGPIILPNDAGDFIHWVICGAETGPGARKMEPGWVYDLHTQSRNLGISFFFKKPSKGDEGKSSVFDIREFPVLGSLFQPGERIVR